MSAGMGDAGHGFLGELRQGDRAVVLAVGDSAMARALLEMGLIEGSTIRVVHEAPLSRDPIAVEVRGALIALRRLEAMQVRVKRLPAGGAS